MALATLLAEDEKPASNGNEKYLKETIDERRMGEKVVIAAKISKSELTFSTESVYLQKLYSIITNPTKSNNFAALESYLKNDLGVNNATELFDYLELSEIMTKIRYFLNEGGKALFDNTLKNMK